MASEYVQSTVRAVAGERSGPLDHLGGWSRFRWLLPVLIALIVMTGLIFWKWDFLNKDPGDVVPVGFAILLSVLLSALPPVLCFVQNVSRRRQLSKLHSLSALPVAKTTFFQTARRSINSIRLVVDADYVVPIFLFFLITFIGFLAVLIAYSREQLFSTASVLLGGLEDRSDPAKFAKYQLETFGVIAMAFIGSYVYSLSRIIERINNNDLYPISLYYYAVRIIVACAAAAVIRHTLGVFGDATDGTLISGLNADARPLLLLIGFAIGFAPDLFIVAISRRAFQAMKLWGSRRDPDEKTWPASLPLLMIDDLTREKIDRLDELGIDSAQMLARQNPFMLLPRLPYDLGLLVDWIGQAQLYALVKDGALQKLRDRCVRDVFDLHVRLENDKSRPQIVEALGLTDDEGAVLLQQLDSDPSFLRLRQVRNALAP